EATQRQAEQVRSERERAETLLYGAEMTLAQRDLNDGDPDAVTRRLAVYPPADPGPPDRRRVQWVYLDRPCHSDVLTLGRRKYSTITCVTFSPDGRLIVTGDMSNLYGTIAVWEVPTGRLLRSWRGRSPSVNALAFHPDGVTLASIDVTSPIIT